MKLNGEFFTTIFLTMSLFAVPSYGKKTSSYYIEKAQNDLPPQCMFFFKMYLNAKDHKAFAYTIDNSSKYTCRFSSSSKDDEKAKEVALASCQKSRIKRKIKNPCQLYEIDVKGFRSDKGVNFTKKYKDTLKKIEHELDKNQKIINNISEKNNTNQTIKQDITKKSKKSNLSTLPKPCHMFYKLYKNAPSFKAFAIAIDDDIKYVCKFSANSDTLKKAKDVALKSCMKSKKKRGVKAECKIFEAIPSQKKIIKKIKPKRDPKLEKAILNTDLNKIKKLIKAGADVNVVANDGSRALFVAAAKGDVEFVKELFKRGANPYFKKGDGNNLLVAAIMSGNLEMLKIMLKHKISPNKRCNDGNTPLHFAFMMFDDRMMKELYKYGARDDIKNNKGQTVRDMAKEYSVNLKKLKR